MSPALCLFLLKLFGLGADNRIKEIELRCPSGTIQVLRNVKSDQILKITEGEK